MLAKSGAVQVLGCDRDEGTVRYASLRNRLPNLAFEQMDAESLSFTQEFDLIISFETIEHLDRPDVFLQRINNALKKTGCCFISTPISNLEENRKPDNIFHRFEWGFRKFQKMVARHLNIQNVFLQLTRPEKQEGGFLTRAINNLRSRQSDRAFSESLIPQKWNPGKINEEEMGRQLNGYQILECIKKDA
jgi:2-polyprenyl-3-methyl-5-hydroxy-6-metoxy-1,4-benzoquinol methylase